MNYLFRVSREISLASENRETHNNFLNQHPLGEQLAWSTMLVRVLNPVRSRRLLSSRALSSINKKWIASESEVPTAWYNIQADLPIPLPPPLHPGELRLCGPEDFAPLFPMSLIAEEFSSERYIEIPEPVREVLSIWRPSPLIRASRWEKALGLPENVKIFYKY